MFLLPGPPARAPDSHESRIEWNQVYGTRLRIAAHRNGGVRYQEGELLLC